MDAQTIEEGRRLRADLVEKQRIVDEWEGPKLRVSGNHVGPYAVVEQKRDDADRALDHWQAEHSEDLLELALDRNEHSARVAQLTDDSIAVICTKCDYRSTWPAGPPGPFISKMIDTFVRHDAAADERELRERWDKGGVEPRFDMIPDKT